ncbi:MAG: hypothetical protein AAGD32_14450 [Planctomycetota bacterium]
MPEPSPMKVYPDAYHIEPGQNEPLEYAAPAVAPVSGVAWYIFGTFAGLILSIGLGMAFAGLGMAMGAREDPTIFLGIGVAMITYGLILFALPIARHRLLTQHTVADR